MYYIIDAVQYHIENIRKERIGQKTCTCIHVYVSWVTLTESNFSDCVSPVSVNQTFFAVGLTCEVPTLLNNMGLSSYQEKIVTLRKL